MNIILIIYLYLNIFLKDIDSFPKDKVWSASTYLVAKTFESLREMFTSTKEIQVKLNYYKYF
jgi:hypothetical protein